MRISIALSILILAIGSLIGWQDHQRLVNVRASHAKLVAEAAVSGIIIDPAHPEDGVRITKRERENKDEDARNAAARFIAFAQEMQAAEEKGGEPDEDNQKKVIDLMDLMMSLDAAQLKIVIAEIRASKDLKDEMRQGLIGFSIMTLANDHPQAALTLFTESSDLMNGNGMSEHVISSSLAKWAKDDPLAALEWVRKNGEKFPDIVNDDAKRGMISGAAANDPKLAFQLIGELGLKNANDAIRGITDAATTPEQRNATLTALREHLATISDDKARDETSSRAIQSLARNAANEGFEAGSKWIESAGFTPEQLAGMADGGFAYNVKGDDTGKWIEWMGENLPDGKSNNGIRSMVGNWTQNDYQAAGKWLSATPDGPAKNISVRSYAETVSKYEPETATQWAMTLPPGKDREQTLKSIYQNWPKGDEASKAAAEAFKAEYGIK
jgi:hypothetical protein